MASSRHRHTLQLTPPKVVLTEIHCFMVKHCILPEFRKRAYLAAASLHFVHVICSIPRTIRPTAERSLFKLEHIQMWTKLRPGVRTFLAQAMRYFELWIHTNGNRWVPRRVNRAER